MVLVEYFSCYSCIFHDQHNLQAHKFNSRLQFRMLSQLKFEYTTEERVAPKWETTRTLNYFINKGAQFNYFCLSFPPPNFHDFNFKKVTITCTASRRVCKPALDLMYCFSPGSTGPWLLKGFSLKMGLLGWVFGFWLRIAIACLIDYFPELLYSCSRMFPRVLSLASLNLTWENLI